MSHMRLTRDDIVRAQYENAVDVSGYAASYGGDGPAARYFHSRLYVVDEALRLCTGGALLDVGCGPGMLVQHVLDTRDSDFRITACDRSGAMIDATRSSIKDSGDSVDLVVARIEDMPFPDRSFDVVVGMGVLEYSVAERALREVARVLRPNGLLVLTMLNPVSPYRLFEWCVYWPALRMLGRVERLLGVAAERRHGTARSGIRAFRLARLRRMVRNVGIAPDYAVHYDVTPLVPPFDKLLRPLLPPWRGRLHRTVSRGAGRWLGTAYLMVARQGPAGITSVSRRVPPPPA